MTSPRNPALRHLCVVCTTLAVLAQPALAHACTVCDSPNGHAVRAGLLNGHFLLTLTLVLLPFPILAALVPLVTAGMPDLAPPAVTPAPDAMPPAELLPHLLA